MTDDVPDVGVGRLDDEEFERLRRDVLASWPTGADVDVDEAIGFHEELGPERRLANLFEDAARNGYTLLNPYGGLAPLGAYLELLDGFEEDGTVDFLPMSIDSHTRTNEYARADAAVAESEALGRSMLNGFPIVHYGVAGCREVTSHVTRPVISRLSAVDARLVAEISFAGGCTGLTGSPMASFTCYTRDQRPETVIRNWQYVERLVGTYAEHGVPIVRDHPQFNIGAAHPPSLSTLMAILNALIAAGQGAPIVAPAHQQQGSVLQNVASALVERKLVREYLDRLGFEDTVAHHIMVTWVGQFPVDGERALAILCTAGLVASLAGFTDLVCKSADEGRGLARPEVNRSSLRAVRQVMDMAAFQRYPLGDPAVAEEMAMIELEVRAMMDAVLELGDGDPVVGICRGFTTGVIDVPYAPNRLIAGEVTTAYDRTGAARYLDFGRLPMPDEVRRYHRGRLEDRARADGRAVDFEMAVDDIMAGIAAPHRRGYRPRALAPS